MQRLVKFLKNSLYGQNIRKVINEEFKCKPEYWMQTEYDENVLEFWQLLNGEYIVTSKQDDGLECDTGFKNTMPAPLGSFILSNKGRIMNNFIREINGLKTYNEYFTDTDSLCIEKKHWDDLDKAGLVGDKLCQGKNDYKSGGIFY